MFSGKLKDKMIKKHGQALLFVIVAVTVALTIGIAVSSRAVSTFSRTTRSDTSSREYSAAEGAAELALTQPVAFYAKLTSTITDAECKGMSQTASAVNIDGAGNWGCKVTYSGTNDPIQSQAILDAKALDASSSSFSLSPGNVKEVMLDSDKAYDGVSLTLCWDTPEAAIYYLLYTKEPVEVASGGLMPASFSHASDVPNFTSVAANSSANGDYGNLPYCALIDFNDMKNLYGLRIRALYKTIPKVAIYPEKGKTLPLQGYILISTGQLVSEGQVKTSKILEIYRSLPYLPGSFDYSLYSSGNIFK